MSSPIQAILALSAQGSIDPEALALAISQLARAPLPVLESDRDTDLRTLLALLPLTKSPTTLATMLQHIKLLGRQAAGSEALATPAGLRALLKVSGLARLGKAAAVAANGVEPADDKEDLDWKELEKEAGGPDPLAPQESEALRCICNALTLHVRARSAMPAVLLGTTDDEVVTEDGRDRVRGIELLLGTSKAGFLAARVLFLISSERGPAVTFITEESGMVQRIAKYLSYCGQLLREQREKGATGDVLAGAAPSVGDILQDELKSTYNLTLQYGRLVGEKAAEGQGDGDTSSPLKAIRPFLPIFVPLLSLAVLLPSPAADPTRMLRHVYEALLNFPIETEELDGWQGSWMQDVVSGDPAGPRQGEIVLRTLALLEGTLGKHFSLGKEAVKPDDYLDKHRQDAAIIEETVAPIALVLGKLALLEGASQAIKATILPENIDRTVGLEQRSDLTGLLVRLMDSVYLPNTATAVSDLLFNICRRDPSRFAREIGYGNAAGYLQNIGQLIPPPDANEAEETTTDSKPINPITGAYDKPDGEDPMAGLTDEEKEREAERLFVLFDRLSKTGVITAENPVAKAQQEGRFEEVTDADDKLSKEDREKLQQEEDARELKEAEDEIRRWKERDNKHAAEHEAPAFASHY